MQQKKTFIIGLMSGTSLDGVDLVYVSFESENNYSFQIIEAETFPYSDTWKSKLQNAFTQSESVINQLDKDYGVYLGELMNTFIADNKIDQIDFIASHGHTIFHKPEEGYTLQIGDGKTIAQITKHKIVYDFRSQDVALGGQGAPLVPIGDKLLFSEYAYCLNLGGFANVSFETNGERIAFDICPVNIVMNHYANKLGLEYDDGGTMASQGTINEPLLNDLNALAFYSAIIPKSLGYEFIVSEVFPIIEKYQLSEKDVLRTFIEHIAIQIASKVMDEGELFITGGGVYNTFLISRMKELMTNQIVIPSDTIINFKESLIFALLGLLRLENQVNCLQSVTNAKKDHSSGEIYTPN